jgi:hypothetical protein
MNMRRFRFAASSGRNTIAVLLAFGYLLMALLVIEQGRTIDNQRQLIRALFQDSIELSAVRLQLHNPHRR